MIKIFTIRNAGIATAIAVLAGVGVAGFVRNADPVEEQSRDPRELQLTIGEFNILRNDLAEECLEGPMEINRFQLMLLVFDKELKGEGPVTVGLNPGDGIEKLCSIMIR